MSSQSSSSGVDIGVAVGASFGGILLIGVTAAVWYCRARTRNRERGGAHTTPPPPIATGNRRTNGAGGGDTDVPLPPYRRHPDPRELVRESDIQYDIPAAFDLAAAVKASDNRIRRAQRQTHNLRAHATGSKEVGGGEEVDSCCASRGVIYGSDTPEHARLNTLRLTIAQLMEPLPTRFFFQLRVCGWITVSLGGGAIFNLEFESHMSLSSSDVLGATVTVVDTPPSGSRGTLSNRMLEIQELLAQIDSLTSRSEVRELPQSSADTTIQRLKADVGHLMEAHEDPQRASGLGSHDDQGLDTGGGGGTQNKAGGVDTLPPPYQAVVSDGRDVVGTGEIR